MYSFPAFVPLEDARIAFAGTGEALAGKLALFEGSPAQVVRLGGEAALDPLNYDGCKLAFIGHPEVTFREAASAAARAAGCWVNAVDDQTRSDFYSGAIVDRGVVVIGIGTTGHSPLLAGVLRRRIEARLHPGLGKIAILMSWLRDEVKAASSDPVHRRALLRAALDGEAAALAQDGDVEGAAAMLKAAMAGARPGGKVAFIDAAGPADRLSLRAHRLLSIADAILVEAGVDADILAMTRRDARRLAEGEDLAGLAKGGEIIARLTDGPPDANEIVALDHQGVETEILRPAPL